MKESERLRNKVAFHKGIISLGNIPFHQKYFFHCRIFLSLSPSHFPARKKMIPGIMALPGPYRALPGMVCPVNHYRAWYAR